MVPHLVHSLEVMKLLLKLIWSPSGCIIVISVFILTVRSCSGYSPIRTFNCPCSSVSAQAENPFIDEFVRLHNSRWRYAPFQFVSTGQSANRLKISQKRTNYPECSNRENKDNFLCLSSIYILFLFLLLKFLGFFPTQLPSLLTLGSSWHANCRARTECLAEFTAKQQVHTKLNSKLNHTAWICSW